MAKAKRDIGKILALYSTLLAIYEDVGDKKEGACPVCHTYSHKKWCWYPRLLKVLGRPLDKFDEEYLERAEADND